MKRWKLSVNELLARLLVGAFTIYYRFRFCRKRQWVKRQLGGLVFQALVSYYRFRFLNKREWVLCRIHSRSRREWVRIFLTGVLVGALTLDYTQGVFPVWILSITLAAYFVAGICAALLALMQVIWCRIGPGSWPGIDPFLDLTSWGAVFIIALVIGFKSLTGDM